ncbi:MAG: NADH:flavin oxidoreductase/NADH oxidase [Segniliparus sp.]|uniref:NADH:flavin oxidoreductase/NADH oxidase n=1 Tax=Segniliparus sp. TaxID=2804064 RepID=UPI003F2AEAF7
MANTPKLFQPFTLRDVTFRNRVWLSPMCQYSVVKEDGVPFEWHLVHLGARAAGGFGLVVAEAAAVTADGRISPQDVGIWNDAQRDAWRPIVDFIHGQGAKAGIQIAHAGRKASTYRGFPGEPTGSVPLAEGGWATVAPSPVPFEGYPEPHELDKEQIGEIVQAFADAAKRSDEAGFDVVEIHGAHGYLAHEFLSPLSNKRDDEYGGDFAGRTKFLLDTVDAVRRVWPEGKPLFVRISGTDWTEGGWDVEQSGELATVLAERGVDLVDVSSGGNVLADIPVGPNYQVPLATHVRKQSGLPVAAVGLITEPEQAEAVLDGEEADAVFIARAALREPTWPLRAAATLGVTWRDAPYPAQYARGKWDDVIDVDA